MRLKHVTVKGFKAYKDETRVHLHPGANAIVGSNGSGKSSLLEAITLVVSEVYGKRTTDVKNYFHRGQRNSVLTAFIELCFDNRDRRIAAIDKDEIRFRRTFHYSGTKKDELQVDGKRVTKAEFSSLLEAGGFSKSNPYYVIRQGKIIEMAEMTDEGRLKLLKDFSGVQIYEEKRALAAESLRNSQDVASQADEQMKDLEKRLSELEEQKKELLEYRELVHSVEVYRTAINESEATDFNTRLETLSSRLSIIDQESKQIRQIIDSLSNQIEGSQAEQREVHHVITRKEEECGDLVMRIQAVHEAEVTAEIEFESRQAEMQKRRAEIQRRHDLLHEQRENLQAIETNLQVMGTKQSDLKILKTSATQDLMKLTAELQMAQDKKERCEKFKSQAARKSHLEAEIRKLEITLDTHRQQQKRLQTDLEVTEKEAAELQLASSRTSTLEIDARLREVQDNRVEIDRKRLTLMEEQSLVQDKLQRLRKLPATRQMSMQGMDGLRQYVKDRTWRGYMGALYWDATIEKNDPYLRADDLSLLTQSFDLGERLHRSNPRVDAEKWTRGHEVNGLKIPGVLGTLWSLIRVPDQYKVAVSVAINIQLDNVVCMNDGLASLIAADLKKRRSDETINLAPLNQITKQFSKATTQKYPPGVTLPQGVDSIDLSKAKCIPLLSVIVAPDMLRPVIFQVARKWLLVLDSDEGRRFADLGYDCVTLEGDKLSAKGTLQGGHVSSDGILNAADTLRRTFATSSDSGQEVIQFNTRLDEIRHELSSLSVAKRDLDNTYTKLSAEKLSSKNVQARQRERLEELAASKERLKTELSLVEERISAASTNILQSRRILLSNQGETLTKEDIRQIEALDNALSDVKQTIEQVEKEVEEIARRMEKDKRESRKLAAFIESHSHMNDDTSSLQSEQVECESLQRRSTKIRAEKSQLESSLQVAQCDINKLHKSLEEHKKFEDSCRDQYERNSRQHHTLNQEAEKLKAKDFELRQKIKMHEENKLQLLTASHFTQTDIDDLRQKHSTQELQALLQRGEKRLGDCPRVNEKAIEDLAEFQAEFSEKKVEQDQLRKSLDSVAELMRVLDERRSQTLRMSFDMVNTNLQKVFSTLVPGGRAKLVIKKLSDDKVAELIDSQRRSLLAIADEAENRLPTESQMSNATSPAGDSTQNSAYKVQVNSDRVTLQSDGSDPHWDQVAQGIEIKASFRPSDSANDHVHFFPIIALSGGQKTILALSLIFAMQRCDQAPFYIFDECDAALDEGYRSSIAKLIEAATENSQFLITTFRRELCEICDRHFMVTTADRVAQVETVSKEEAIQVILREQENGPRPLMSDD